ncbi:MAG: hypothetical protein M1416_03200 [Candidatus Pacearchaeota archaeon]|nr:hypothetical protein [Candidatus Pacearchaeota archaeon]
MKNKNESLVKLEIIFGVIIVIGIVVYFLREFKVIEIPSIVGTILHLICFFAVANFLIILFLLLSRKNSIFWGVIISSLASVLSEFNVILGGNVFNHFIPDGLGILLAGIFSEWVREN